MDPAAISGIKKTAKACDFVRRELLEWIQPGQTTYQIDQKAIELIRKTGAISAVLGRNNFSGHICICTNNQVAHFSGSNNIISEDDLIKIDISLRMGEWVADCGASIYFGKNESINRLIQTNRQAVIETASSLCSGLPLADIIAVIDDQKDNFHYYDELTCHGTGPKLHSSPEITKHSKEKLRAGQILAIEAVFAERETSLEFKELEISSTSLNAHHEETVLITGNGSEILTSP